MDPSLNTARPRFRSTALAILVGGFACGVFDFIFAIVYYGAPWNAIARSVARGLFSKAIVSTGAPWVIATGIGLHFFISLGAAAVFVLAAHKLAFLTRFPGPAGLVYGIVVYFVMNWVVVPASVITVPKYPPTVDWGALVGHMVLVGLPIALANHWIMRPKPPV
jgi:hypothetical protein